MAKTRKNTRDDIGLDEHGHVIAIGDDAARQQEEIIGHPDANPVLIVAELDGNIGIRVYGPPTQQTAQLLDTVAAQYRHALRQLAASEKVRG